MIVLQFKSLRKSSPETSMKPAENVRKNPGQALDITANVASAVASKAALSSLPELKNFHYTSKGLYTQANLYNFCDKNTTEDTKTISLCSIICLWPQFRSKKRNNMSDIYSFKNSIITLNEWLLTSKKTNQKSKKENKK